jgi:hypothetical protein
LFFSRIFKQNGVFPSLPSLFPMVGHNKPYIGNNLSNSHCPFK